MRQGEMSFLSYPSHLPCKEHYDNPGTGHRSWSLTDRRFSIASYFADGTIRPVTNSNKQLHNGDDSEAGVDNAAANSTNVDNRSETVSLGEVIAKRCICCVEVLNRICSLIVVLFLRLFICDSLPASNDVEQDYEATYRTYAHV